MPRSRSPRRSDQHAAAQARRQLRQGGDRLHRRRHHDDAKRAYDTIGPINPNFCIMQCTSAIRRLRAAEPEVIETFMETFPDIVIASPRTIAASHAAGGLHAGARVFEKHFTMNRAWKGTDQAFSLEPAGLKRVVRDLHRTVEALGDGQKVPYESETRPLNKMVSVWAVRDLPAGHVLAEADIDYRSRSNPRSPQRAAALLVDHFVGKTLKAAVPAQEIIGWIEIGETPKQG